MGDGPSAAARGPALFGRFNSNSFTIDMDPVPKPWTNPSRFPAEYARILTISLHGPYRKPPAPRGHAIRRSEPALNNTDPSKRSKSLLLFQDQEQHLDFAAFTHKRKKEMENFAAFRRVRTKVSGTQLRQPGGNTQGCHHCAHHCPGPHMPT